MSEADEFGDLLRQALQRVCPDCELVAVGRDVCQNCGAALPPAPEERSVSFREGALVYNKLPLEESWNLKRLSEALEQLKEGTIELPDYRSTVGEVLKVAQLGLDTLKSLQLEELPVRTIEILLRTQDYSELFLDGCSCMLAADLQDLGPAEKGLETVRQALTGLDRAEDDATDERRDLDEHLSLLAEDPAEAE